MFVSINGKKTELAINVLREHVISSLYALRCRKGRINPGDGKITSLICFESQRCNFPLEIEHFTFLWRIAADARDSLENDKEIINNNQLISICINNVTAIVQYGDVKLYIEDCSPEFVRMLERIIFDC